MTARFVTTVVMAGIVTVAAAPRAQAQLESSVPELRPTRGPQITGAVRAGDADATALELNPGLMGLLPAGSLQLVGSIAGEGAVIPRRGAGLYWASPIIGGSSLGLALSRVAGASAVGIDGHTNLRLGYALRIGRSFALGAAWAHQWGGLYSSADTLDLGLAFRLGRHVAFGAVVEDVPRPDALGLALPRLWTAELAVRPTGTDRLELAIGASHAEGDAWSRVVPRARLWWLVTRGLRLYGDAQTSPPPGTSTKTFADNSDLRVGFGLALDLEHVGAMVGGNVYEPGIGPGGMGFAARLYVSGERRAAVVSPTYVARVKLEGVDDDREFVVLVRRLRALAADRGVAGVLFKIENTQLGYARIEELRDLIALLRASGKRTFAYAPSPSMREYYLAAATDAVVVHHAGGVMLTGIAQNVTFYKGALDRIGVHVDLVRVGAYKGAMEPFIMNEQSAPVRANKNQLLDDVFARVVGAIAADRTRAGHRMDAAEVRKLIDAGLYTPTEAQLAGLTDGAVDESDLETVLGKALGRRAVAIRDPDTAPVATGRWPGRRLAVVLVDGNIVDGASRDLPLDGGAVAGSDSLVEALDACGGDASVGAVVLRVNSPGGSAFASDVIARAVIRLRAAGKPVIVSMGDYAASGGYYIAAPGDVIFADPSTVSGSIGVFGFKVDVRTLLPLLGVSVETNKRGAHADYLSPYRPWTEGELKMTMDKIRNLYGLFIDTVAAGRKSRGLTVARVDELGRGQVWTGALAQSVGLVDRMGGLSAAIDEAVRLGRIPLGRDSQPDIEVLPKSPSGLVRRLLGMAGHAGDAGQGGAAPMLLTPEMRAAVRMIAPLLLGGGRGFQARLPYDIDLR